MPVAKSINRYHEALRNASAYRVQAARNSTVPLGSRLPLGMAYTQSYLLFEIQNLKEKLAVSQKQADKYAEFSTICYQNRIRNSVLNHRSQSNH